MAGKKTKRFDPRDKALAAQDDEISRLCIQLAKAERIIGNLARGWAEDKYGRNKEFRRQVLREARDAYVEFRRERFDENETEAVAAAEELFGVDFRTIQRARTHMRKTRKMRRGSRMARARPDRPITRSS
jgi:hypothetical protein